MTIQRWEPYFNPKEAEIDQVTIWVNLPGFPLRLYDENFLIFPRNRIRKAIEVDNTTINQAKGKYARVCVEIDLKKELLDEYST